MQIGRELLRASAALCGCRFIFYSAFVTRTLGFLVAPLLLFCGVKGLFHLLHSNDPDFLLSLSLRWRVGAHLPLLPHAAAVAPKSAQKQRLWRASEASRSVHPLRFRSPRLRPQVKEKTRCRQIKSWRGKQRLGLISASKIFRAAPSCFWRNEETVLFVSFFIQSKRAFFHA